ncbi:hypothetical protein EMIT07CA2_20340 [Brevibacillus sp. IT-7CA2]
MLPEGYPKAIINERSFDCPYAGKTKYCDLANEAFFSTIGEREKYVKKEWADGTAKDYARVAARS